MAEVNIDVAKESTSQEILKKSQDIHMDVVGLINKDATLTCTASDNILFTPLTSEKTINTMSTILIAQYKVTKVSGTLRLTASAKEINSMIANSKQPSVYTDGATQNATLNFEGITSYTTKSADFTVKDGDVVSIYAHADAVDVGYVNLVTISGDFSEPVTPVPSIKAV